MKGVVHLIRGGGKQGAIVFETLAIPVGHVYVWDDAETVHPLLSSLHRFHAGKTHFSAEYSQICCYLAVGSGKLRHVLLQSVLDHFKGDERLCFPSVIHPSAFLAPSARIEQGCFVGPFAVVHTNAKVQEFCIVNTAAIVEHDCVVGKFCSLNPGSILSGTVTVGNDVMIGSNAAVRDNRQISAGVTVGMGAAVVKNLAFMRNDVFYGGVPANPKSGLPDPSNVLEKTSADSNVKEQVVRWCIKKNFSTERFIRYLKPSIEKGHLTNDGPLQAILTARVQKFVQTKRDVLMAASGTAALHALIAGISLKHDSVKFRWVTQAFTFPSSIQGPLCNALIADLDPVLLGPSMEFLEQLASAQVDLSTPMRCFQAPKWLPSTPVLSPS